MMLVKNSDEIRECTNKTWVLGSARFKAQIEQKTNGATVNRGHGGDRKYQAFLGQRIWLLELSTNKIQIKDQNVKTNDKYCIPEAPQMGRA